jgi:hypothetical protein
MRFVRRPQTYSIYRIKYLFFKFLLISVNTFLKYIDTLDVCTQDTLCVQPRKKGRPKVHYKIDLELGNTYSFPACKKKTFHR